MINNERWAIVLWRKFQTFPQNLNLFPSVPPSTNAQELRTQRISTRLFIVLLILSMTILLLYTSLVASRKTVNVQTPTLAQYEQLNLAYSQTLKCPCAKISINYRTFLRIEYTLHQVCSSVFVNQSWIDYLATPMVITPLTRDFRKISPFLFQALRTFCELSNSTIADSLTQFYSRQYVSASVIPEKLFQSAMTSLVAYFKVSTTNSFLLFRSMIRDTTQANTLFSGLQTNYHLVIATTKYDVGISPLIYNNCNCASLSTCIDQSSIYKYSNEIRLFNISGFYTGCYVIESLLQSTLQCFYSQQCIDDIQVFLPPSPLMQATALDSSLPSRYPNDSIIEDLVNNLMIEQWNISSLYNRYYNECQPTQCTYTIETRNDLIYIATTLFGIAGGLTTVLEVVVPRLVKFIMYCIRKLSGRVVPAIPIVQT